MSASNGVPIQVVAGCLVNTQRQLLVVRKRNTERFMLPGGKPEASETAAQTLAREWQEELGIRPQGELTLLGTFSAAAANEPGQQVKATVLLVEHADTAAMTCAAEIADYTWLTLDALEDLPLAPLLRESIVPALLIRYPQQPNT